MRRIFLIGLQAEEHRLPVGRPDFKSGGTREGVFGRFDSYLFRHKYLQTFSGTKTEI